VFAHKPVRASIHDCTQDYGYGKKEDHKKYGKKDEYKKVSSGSGSAAAVTYIHDAAGLHQGAFSTTFKTYAGNQVVCLQLVCAA